MRGSQSLVTSAGILFALACRGVLVMMAIGATIANAAAPGRNPPALEKRWGGGVSYKLEERTLTSRIGGAPGGLIFENPIVAGDMRRKRGSRGVDQASSSWSSRIGKAGRQDFSAQGLVSASWKMETLPVTVLGQRFVLSHFTLNRRGARGMISTAF